MMRASVALAMGLLLAGCSTADATPPKDANPDFTCALRHPSKSVNSLRKLPAPVQAYIRDKLGAIADRGEFFNAGDAVTRPGPFNRYIRGGSITSDIDGEHWFLWYEHGGFAYWRQIVLFKKDQKTGAAVVTAETHGRDLCADTDALLDKAGKVGL